ncbi:MAG: hypothetical protein KC613_04530 [Myxococcales bacterium]|nr:hypothetical protein [Myxococcales bacterium]
MKRLMLAAAAGLLFAAPVAQAAPPARRPMKAPVKRATPKKATAGDQAGQAAAGALASLCPATLTCKVGQTGGVVLNKASGPAHQSDGRLGCLYETGFVQVDTRRNKCQDVPVSLAGCSGHNKRVASLSRGWVSYRSNTPRDGKCNVQAHVRLQTK